MMMIRELERHALPLYGITLQRSAGKVMATVFWNTKDVVLLDFLERNHTVTGQHYLDKLEEQLHSIH